MTVPPIAATFSPGDPDREQAWRRYWLDAAERQRAYREARLRWEAEGREHDGIDRMQPWDPVAGR